MAYGGFSARDWSRHIKFLPQLFYLSSPDTLSTPPHRLRGFGRAPLSIPQSRLRTFQYFLALLLDLRRVAYAEGNMAARESTAADSDLRMFYSELGEECSLFCDLITAKLSRLGKEDVFHDKARPAYAVLPRVQGDMPQLFLPPGFQRRRR